MFLKLKGSNSKCSTSSYVGFWKTIFSNILPGSADMFALWGHKSLLWRSRHRSCHKIHPVGSGRGPLPMQRNLSTYEICRQVWLLAGLKGLMLPLCEIGANVMMKLLMAFRPSCRRRLLLRSVTVIAFCSHLKEFLTISHFLHIEKLIFYYTLITGLMLKVHIFVI